MDLGSLGFNQLKTGIVRQGGRQLLSFLRRLGDRRHGVASHPGDQVQQRLLGDRLQITELPKLPFGAGPRQTFRYFPDKMPIGIRLHEDPIVFAYLMTKPTPFDFRIFLWRHAELLRALTPPDAVAA